MATVIYKVLQKRGSRTSLNTVNLTDFKINPQKNAHLARFFVG